MHDNLTASKQPGAGMPTDWIALVRERGNEAKAFAPQVLATMHDPAITLPSVIRISRSLEAALQEIDELIERIEEDDAPNSVRAAAESLANLYAEFAAIAVARMTELREKMSARITTPGNARASLQ